MPTRPVVERFVSPRSLDDQTPVAERFVSLRSLDDQTPVV